MSGKKNDYAYSDKPLEQDGLVRCCECPVDIRKHVKKRVTGKFKTNYVDTVMMWCCRCGRTLSNKDADALNDNPQIE